MTVTRSMFQDQNSYDLYTSSLRHVVSLSSVVPPKAAGTLCRYSRIYEWVVAKDEPSIDPVDLLSTLICPCFCCCGSTKVRCESITEEQAIQYLHNSHSKFDRASLSQLKSSQVVGTVFSFAMAITGVAAAVMLPVNHKEDKHRKDGWEHDKAAGDHAGKAWDEWKDGHDYAASREFAEAWKEKSAASRDYTEANKEMMRESQEQVEQSWADRGGEPGCIIS